MQEDVCMLFANTMPFSIRDSSFCGLWYLRGVMESALPHPGGSWGLCWFVGWGEGQPASRCTFPGPCSWGQMLASASFLPHPTAWLHHFFLLVLFFLVTHPPRCAPSAWWCFTWRLLSFAVVNPWAICFWIIGKQNWEFFPLQLWILMWWNCFCSKN